ncbi:MAG: leucine--tRNA ligase [Nannocystaceae bacterium]|nr:leucine--tRNA ligase [Nannocystaceae bacterium]
MVYDHQAIERRWQEYWERNETFRAEVDPERPKFYVLDMFPYPSGDGLHVGHVEGYTATDIISRYKRMRGFNVLHPMGWDAFGLPAERHAMKTGVHPARVIENASGNFRRQLKRLGFSYDWRRELSTTDPGYYHWTQWIFLQLWGSYYDRQAQRARPIAQLPIPPEVTAAGPAAIARYRDDRRLAYLDDAPVNWCPALRVVLANEEVAEKVEDGYEVVRRPMRQWVLRITEYAERLLADLEGLDWPPHVLEIQRNWVGRSEGAEIDFAVDGHAGALTVFTTRPDTLYGATYMVLAPEHPLVAEITTAAQQAEVRAYVDRTARRSERERQAESIEGKKTGAFTGAHAIHPLSGAKIPIWIADYVLLGYGTGAIMAVPGHDERDHAFARAMALPIVQVVAPADGAAVDIAAAAFVGEGVAVNSPVIDGQSTAAAKRTMIDHLVAHGRGRARVTYKLRDWLFSRQRYWGEPFPLAYTPAGEAVPVPEDQLPVLLPEVADYDPSEDGEPPLSRATAWKQLPDGSVRETNTMPQWAGSCWYYLRFCDPGNGTLPWSKQAESYWMPVDLYVGGVEHAATHLLYSRFWHKVLFDLGHVSEPEPFRRLVNQGMILGATFLPLDRRKDDSGKKLVFLPAQVEERDDPDRPGSKRWVVRETGEPVEIQWDKMSKSRGNVVNPDEVVASYGADSVRLYEMFMGPLEHSAPWQTEGLAGVHRFLGRVWKLFFPADDGSAEAKTPRALAAGEGTPRQRRLLHRTIADVTDRTERLSFNTAISALMVFVRDIVAAGDPAADPEAMLPRGAATQFCLLLAPYAPHLAEELWSVLGHAASLAHEPWPAADEAWLVDDTFTLVVQVDGKWRAEIAAPKSASKDELVALARGVEDVAKRLVGVEPRRVVVVPGRLVNFVL